MGNIAQILEIGMILAFGLSWPNNIITSLRNKSTKGKNLLFMILIDVGYICGITAKLISGSIVWYVLFFYVLNFLMVGLDALLYIRNRRIEKGASK